MRDIPPLYQLQDEHIFAIAEKQDWEGECQKDKSEQKMFEPFAAGIEDLYTKVLEPYIRKTPALLDAFAMRWWWQGHGDAYWHHIATPNTSNEG